MMQRDPPKFAKGDRVRITWHDIPQQGEVMMTSPNGVSLLIGFDDAESAGGPVLPLLWNGQRFVTLVAGVAVQVERVEHATKH